MMENGMLAAPSAWAAVSTLALGPSHGSLHFIMGPTAHIHKRAAGMGLRLTVYPRRPVLWPCSFPLLLHSNQVSGTPFSLDHRRLARIPNPAPPSQKWSLCCWQNLQQGLVQRDWSRSHENKWPSEGLSPALLTSNLAFNQLYPWLANYVPWFKSGSPACQSKEVLF